MAVLISGLGYIGAALAEHFLSQDREVVGLENFFSTPAVTLERLGRFDRFQLIEGSVTDPEAIRQAFAAQAIDAVFHLAAQASTHSEAAPADQTEATNYTGARLVLEACAAHRVRSIVVASSTRLYATPLPRRISESSPIAPRDVVHLSHLYAEVLLRHLAGAQAGWRPTLVAARLGTIHGVGPVLKIDPRFLAAPQLFCHRAAQRLPLRVTSGPEAVLALIQVREAALGLETCLELPVGFHAVNLAAEVRSVAEVAEVVRQAAAGRGIDVPVEVIGGPALEPRRTISSALRRQGFRPQLRIEQSLPAVLDYYLQAAPKQSSKGGRA